MAVLKCLSLFNRVILDQAQADLYGFQVGDALILSDLEVSIQGLSFIGTTYDYAAQIGDEPGRTIAACTLEAPQGTLDVAIAHPGVLGFPVSKNDAKAFLQAAGLTVQEVLALYHSDEAQFFDNVKAWLHG